MPSTSGPQHRAMEAAAHGKGELGIPASVGKDFEQADKGKSFKDAQLRAFCDGVEKLAKRLDAMDCWSMPRVDSFDESKHPRSSNGQFGSGAGSPDQKLAVSREKTNAQGKPDPTGKFIKNPLPMSEFGKDGETAFNIASRCKNGAFSKIVDLKNPQQVQSSQHVLVPEELDRYLQNPDSEPNRSKVGKSARPVVMKFNGGLYVSDGNHRLAAAAVSGRSINVKLIDVDAAIDAAKKIVKPGYPLGPAVQDISTLPEHKHLRK